VNFSATYGWKYGEFFDSVNFVIGEFSSVGRPSTLNFRALGKKAGLRKPGTGMPVVIEVKS
jgi:hypothetical protein